MFAGYHYTLNPKKPGYDGLWGTHPEFGLMRGTENIIGTVSDSAWFPSISQLELRVDGVSRCHIAVISTWLVTRVHASREGAVAVSRRCRSTQVVDESWQGQFSGQLGMLPARVTLSLYFFQETRDKKKLVASSVKAPRLSRPRPEGVTADDGETLIDRGT